MENSEQKKRRGYKTSQGQIEANLRWLAKDGNREKKRYYSSKSTCKNFIQNRATLEDLKNILELVKEQIKILTNKID